MLRQRSISQHVAASRVRRRTSPALPHHRGLENSAADTTSPGLHHPPSGRSFPADVKISAEEIAPPLSSTPVEKLLPGWTNRPTLLRTDVTVSPLFSSELPSVSDLGENRSVKVEPSSVLSSSSSSPAKAFLEDTSPPKPASKDFSGKLGEGKTSSVEAAAEPQMSPIAKNNQTLLQHLKRPLHFAGPQSDVVDMKKLRAAPASDVRSPVVDHRTTESTSPDEAKASQSSDRSSSLLSVTFNPPSRQSLSVRTTTSQTSSGRTAAGDRTVSTAKCTAASSGFVSLLSSWQHNLVLCSYIFLS